MEGSGSVRINTDPFGLKLTDPEPTRESLGLTFQALG
jgi:hypothetical protein